MDNKLFISILILGILIVGFTFLIIDKHQNNSQINNLIESKSDVYQGPVRPTDDLDYFRKTGITKKLGDNNGYGE